MKKLLVVVVAAVLAVLIKRSLDQNAANQDIWRRATDEL